MITQMVHLSSSSCCLYSLKGKRKEMHDNQGLFQNSQLSILCCAVKICRYFKEIILYLYGTRRLTHFFYQYSSSILYALIVQNNRQVIHLKHILSYSSYVILYTTICSWRRAARIVVVYTIQMQAYILSTCKPIAFKRERYRNQLKYFKRLQ